METKEYKNGFIVGMADGYTAFWNNNREAYMKVKNGEWKNIEIFNIIPVDYKEGYMNGFIESFKEEDSKAKKGGFL